MMRTRKEQLVAATLAGVAAGASGDIFLSPAPLGIEDTVVGILASPLAVTFGGGHVSLQGFESFFLIGGLFFWPVYVLLSVLWLRLGNRAFLLFVLLWAAQGFFQVGLRWAVMSGI